MSAAHPIPAFLLKSAPSSPPVATPSYPSLAMLWALRLLIGGDGSGGGGGIHTALTKRRHELADFLPSLSLSST